jgi:protoporphyrinogen/coproporphyrinogen III oxidase
MNSIIGRIDPQDRNVTIWGAGFSGLVLAFFLKQQGYRLTIYERASHAGGKIRTKKTKFGIAENAANALYVNPDVLELLKELKLEPLVASKKLKRYLMINGKPRRALQLRLLYKLARHAGKRPPLISEGLTVAEFFKPLVGTDYINKYLSPALSGIYAAPAEQLHFKSIFPQLGDKPQLNSYWEFFKILKKSHKTPAKHDLSGSVSFEGGMQVLIDQLVAELRPSIKFNYKEKLQLKGNTIICTDAHSASALLSEVRPALSQELARIKYLELSSSTVFTKRELKPLQRAFGVLIPMHKNFKSIGVLNNRAIFPANYPNTTAYTFIARQVMNRADLLQDIKSISSDFNENDIEHIENFHWEKALPAYDIQRYLTVKKLHQISTQESQLAIFGNYVAGISLREMVSQAKKFAQNCAQVVGADEA